MADKTPTISKLATQRAAVLAQIAGLAEVLKGIDAKLIEQGAGVYQDETGAHAFRVVAATAEKPGDVSYVFPAEPDNQASARKLSGELFTKLFDRITIYEPTEGFDLVARKFLTPAKAARLIELCAVAGKPTPAKKAYVKAA